MNGDQMARIEPLGLTVYRRPRAANKWHLPVCAAGLRGKLEALSPNHPGNWEEVDLDGCPTICYVLTGREIKNWNGLKLTSVWSQFEDRLGRGPAKEFFRDIWVRDNNIRANNRNKWDSAHGGIRDPRFGYGPSVRTVASRSIV